MLLSVHPVAAKTASASAPHVRLTIKQQLLNVAQRRCSSSLRLIQSGQHLNLAGP
jgi:hypothetical protein